MGDAATDSLHVQDRTEEGRSSTASEASGPHRVLVVDTHHYCRSRDYAGSYSRADLGETPQPTLLLGLFGSRLFAKIDLFNLQQTEAPIFTGCGLFPDLRWALADRHGHPRLHRRSPSQSAAVRRSPAQSGAFRIRTFQVGGCCSCSLPVDRGQRARVSTPRFLDLTLEVPLAIGLRLLGG